MNVLARVWDDIRRGENIDLYLTIILALGLVVFNLFGLASEKLVTQITLAVLGMLAIVMLGNRYRIDELLRKDARMQKNFFLEEFPATLMKDFEAASELWLVGVSLSRTIKSNYQRIERKLSQGTKFKVLVVHPGGVGVEMAVSRNYAHRSPEQKTNEIRTTLEYLSQLKQNAPDNLEIRTIQNPLGYGAVAANPGSASGVLYHENYCFRISSDAMPKYVIRPEDGKWYDFYIKELQMYWEAGVEWTEALKKQND
ncbi:MAG: hypothetical protein ACE5I1_29760 [bacterium]